MTSQYRHRRTSNPATPAPTLEPGEIAVNTANRQISLGDAASATLGVPKPLLAIRFFDIAAIYAIGDIVTNAGQIWRALVINGPGAFNAAQWEPAASQVTIASNPPSNAVAGSMWWDSDNGMLYVRYNDGDSSQWVQATAMPVVDTTAFVLKAGDTMTGDLTVNKVTPRLLLDKTAASAQLSQIIGKMNGANRWSMNFGDTVAETGSNVGSDFSIGRHSDAGPFIASALSISRSTGEIQVEHDPTIALGIATKQYVDARAGDAMAYSGMQINGSMEVSQELGNTAITAGAGGAYTSVCDGWRLNKNGAMVVSSQRGPTPIFSGFTNLLQLSVNTAQLSLGAGEYAALSHPIEGYRVSRLGWGAAGARPITISFWICHTRAGTYSVVVGNALSNRSYAASYTQLVAGATEYKTVTIPGDTTGTWETTNLIGIQVHFAVACGTTFTAPSTGSWLSGNYVSGPGQVNNVSTTSDVSRITGVTVLPGTQAPTAAQSPLLMRPYDQELQTCQRYYTKGNNRIIAYAAAAVAAPLQWNMRATPTMTWTFTPNANVVVGTSNVVASGPFDGFVFVTAGGPGSVDTYYTYNADIRL